MHKKAKGRPIRSHGGGLEYFRKKKFASQFPEKKKFVSGVIRKKKFVEDYVEKKMLCQYSKYTHFCREFYKIFALRAFHVYCVYYVLKIYALLSRIL